MIISNKRQYQDTASIREPGRCRPEFCDQPVDQTSRDPKLGARRNHKFLSHFRLIGQETNLSFLPDLYSLKRLRESRLCPRIHVCGNARRTEAVTTNSF